MSKVWLTSDLHIGHEFIARMRTGWVGYPADWMGAVEWHDTYLAQQWDSVVGKDDTVWVLGDISSGTKRAQYNALQWISERAGAKRLVAGNHDGPFPNNRDADKWDCPYHDVFESVHHAIRRRIPLVGGHTDVWLSHMPYSDEGTGIGQTGRYQALRLHDVGDPIVHGHTHSKLLLTRAPHMVTFNDPHPDGTLQLHVGVDAWRGALCPLDWIVAQVQAEVGVSPALERQAGTESDIGGDWRAFA